MYDRTSVRLLKRYNEMVLHSSTSNDTGFQALDGVRFPLNILRLDPPFFGRQHCTEALDYANDDFWLRSVLLRSLPPPL